MSMETYDQLIEMNKVDNVILQSDNDDKQNLVDAKEKAMVYGFNLRLHYTRITISRCIPKAS